MLSFYGITHLLYDWGNYECAQINLHLSANFESVNQKEASSFHQVAIKDYQESVGFKRLLLNGRLHPDDPYQAFCQDSGVRRRECE